MDTNKDCDLELAAKCALLKRQLLAYARADVMGRYDIGVTVLEIRRMARKKKYGNRFVKEAANSCGINTTDLYAAARVAEAWNRTEFEKLVADSDKLAFNHFVALARAQPSRRSQLLEAAQGGVSVTSLKQEVRKTKVIAAKTTRKATKSFTRTIMAAMGKMLDSVKTWQPQVQDVAGTPSAEKVLDRLDDTIKALGDLRSRLGTTEAGNVPTILTDK